MGSVDSVSGKFFCGLSRPTTATTAERLHPKGRDLSLPEKDRLVILCEGGAFWKQVAAEYGKTPTQVCYIYHEHTGRYWTRYTPANDARLREIRT